MTFNKATKGLVHIAVTTALVLAASAATAQTATTAAATTQNRGVAQGVNIPAGVPVYALTSDNAIYVLRPGASNYARLGRVETEGGNLIGMDFRVSDGKLYALTDLGREFLDPVRGLAEWVVANSARMDEARAAYAKRRGLD